jgi:lipoprotein-anchoring transpeptidase ErfK/SrfK
MRLVHAVCAIAAVVLVTKSVAAEPATILAATEPAGPVDTAAPAAPAGHQASDAALPAAAAELTPDEVEKAEPLPPPEPTLFADIDLANQTMTVRDAAGHEYGPWKISSARGGYVTPTGTYTVNWTSRMHYSKQYHWSPMPYSVFFTRGVAVHGTNAIGSLGHPASHGCERVHPKNAKIFYNLVQEHGEQLTRVAVHGKPPYTPAVAEESSRRYRQPTFSPFAFFGEPPPSYQPRQRRYKRQQYGGGFYGAW